MNDQTRALSTTSGTVSPVFKVEQGCPAAPGACGCYGACHELIEVVRASEYYRLLGRIEQLESLGAVMAVAGPLQRAINEAARLLSGALLGHEAGERTFRRGELADLEMALDALHRVRSHA